MIHIHHVTSCARSTGLSTSIRFVLQGSSWQMLATMCGWPMHVAIRTPGNMCHLILPNPGFGNTGNAGDGEHDDTVLGIAQGLRSS
jgi:hypothetical protein